jgi:CHASE3 domain sensor protein
VERQNRKGLKAVLIKLCLSASVYSLWRERNNIRHGNQIQTEEKLIQKISWKSE